MDNYRMAVGIEPTNDYVKAKQDVIFLEKEVDRES